ncbi:MAG: cbb3-type cytochrome c oxidase subunit 3 [Rhodobiaceae bacterium]|nr:cbb3-type cytochrome c oxidase subunit 3 [Rhodobiaceae bacterium]
MYEIVAKISQLGGMIYFVVLFGAVVAYALWPSNKKRFDEAASIPLKED